MLLPPLTIYNPNNVRITGGSIAGTVNIGDTATWTPTLTFATPGDLSVTYSVQQASYTRVGDLATLFFQVVTSAFTHTTASGLLLITGSPFTSANVSNQEAYGQLSWGGITKATYTHVMSRIVANSNQIRFIASGSGVATSAVVAADTPTGGTMNLRGSITFKV